tara:strand:+ start:431 stop:697 length:267 start_codon:yes stop_codon:yes gene_type:complete
MSLCFSSKKENIIELYNGHDDLPENGWIQSCKNCNTKTCQTIEFKKVETDKFKFTFMVYLCKPCKRINIIKNEKFINKLNKYIDIHYL